MANRWLRPEVYPLFAAVGVAVGICGFQLVRNIMINPEVRVNKEGRAAGVLENFAEGEKYAEHFLRTYVRNRAPEIMPSINSYFADSNRNQVYLKYNYKCVLNVNPVMSNIRFLGASMKWE